MWSKEFDKWCKNEGFVRFHRPDSRRDLSITPYLRFVFFIKSPNDVKSVAVSHIHASIYLHIFIHWLDCIYNYYFEIISFVYKNSTCVTESRPFFLVVKRSFKGKAIIGDCANFVFNGFVKR